MLVFEVRIIIVHFCFIDFGGNFIQIKFRRTSPVPVFHLSKHFIRLFPALTWRLGYHLSARQDDPIENEVKSEQQNQIQDDHSSKMQESHSHIHTQRQRKETHRQTQKQRDIGSKYF
eukprot:c28960_g1_i8 orf=2-349(-)